MSRHAAHPGAAHEELACAERVPPEARPTFGVAVWGQHEREDALTLAVFTLEARTKLAAEVKAQMLAQAVLPSHAGWRGVSWAVSAGRPVDVARVLSEGMNDE